MILIDHFFQVLNITFPIRCRQSSPGGSSFKQPAAVGSEQRHIETGIRQLLFDLGIVGTVFFQRNILALRHIRSEFVFTLHHDDGTALGALQVSHFFIQTVNIHFGIFQELGIISSDLHAFHILQPPGVTAKLPFGTNIRSGTKNHHHSFLSGYPDIFSQGFVTREIPFSRFRFVKIPKHIGSYRIQPHAFHHLQAMTPILMRDSGIMHFS